MSEAAQGPKVGSNPFELFGSTSGEARDLSTPTPAEYRAKPEEVQRKLQELVWRGVTTAGRTRDDLKMTCVFWPYTAKNGKMQVRFEGKSQHPQTVVRYLALRLRFHRKMSRFRPSQATLAEHRSLCTDSENCLNVYHFEWDWNDLYGQVKALGGPKPLSGSALKKYDKVPYRRQ